MAEPKYQVGEKVYYSHLRQTGTIKRIINLKDEKDVKRQGYRYEVVFRRQEYTWSILESSLVGTVTRENPQISVSSN